MIKNSNINYYNEDIKNAKEALKSYNLAAAEKYLLYAILDNLDTPETQNLFGALSELKGDINQAEKHYLASNALDPAYKPAIMNLERVTSINYDFENTSPLLE